MVEDERLTAESSRDAGATGQMADLPTKCTGMLEQAVSDTFVLDGEAALTKEECTAVTAMAKESILPDLVNGMARLRHARNDAEVRVTGLIVSLNWDIVIHQGAAETIRSQQGAVQTANAVGLEGGTHTELAVKAPQDGLQQGAVTTDIAQGLADGVKPDEMWDNWCSHESYI